MDSTSRRNPAIAIVCTAVLLSVPLMIYSFYARAPKTATRTDFGDGVDNPNNPTNNQEITKSLTMPRVTPSQPKKEPTVNGSRLLELDFGMRRVSPTSLEDISDDFDSQLTDPERRLREVLDHNYEELERLYLFKHDAVLILRYIPLVEAILARSVEGRQTRGAKPYDEELSEATQIAEDMLTYAKHKSDELFRRDGQIMRRKATRISVAVLAHRSSPIPTRDDIFGQLKASQTQLEGLQFLEADARALVTTLNDLTEFRTILPDDIPDRLEAIMDAVAHAIEQGVLHRRGNTWVHFGFKGGRPYWSTSDNGVQK